MPSALTTTLASTFALALALPLTLALAFALAHTLAFALTCTLACTLTFAHHRPKIAPRPPTTDQDRWALLSKLGDAIQFAAPRDSKRWACVARWTRFFSAETVNQIHKNSAGNMLCAREALRALETNPGRPLDDTPEGFESKYRAFLLRKFPNEAAFAKV